MLENTFVYKSSEIEKALISKKIFEVYETLIERGYDPVSQLTGYLVTNDISYITSYNNAREKIASIGKEKIIKSLIEGYIEK